jgi:hypothetical protein
MQRTFFYTQIKPNDFDQLKQSCQPFSKDIFSADQEHIIAFDQPGQACKAALKFLNKVTDLPHKHDYKIVLVNGEFAQDRPQDLSVRVARSIHQNSHPKNLIFTEEVLSQISSSDIVFEQKAPLFVKALQKEIPTFSLTRFEDTELQVDPTDLFDFSQVDSYSTVDSIKVSPDGEPILPKDPFESSNTTIELDAPKKKVSIETGKIPPATHLTNKTPSQRVQAKPRGPIASETPKTSPRSIAIILVLLALVTFAGFYLAKSKSSTPVPQETAEKTLPIPSIPEPVGVNSAAPAPTTENSESPGIAPSAPQKPVPAIAYVNVHSSPKGAEVWMNGKKIPGKTPISNVKVGTNETAVIELQKAGYTKASKKVDLTPQETRTVMFQLNTSSPPSQSSPQKSQ